MGHTCRTQGKINSTKEGVLLLKLPLSISKKRIPVFGSVMNLTIFEKVT